MSTFRETLEGLIAASGAARAKMLEAIYAGELDGVERQQTPGPEETELGVMLGLAVPLWVQRFVDECRSLDEVMDIGRECGVVVASTGDILQFGSKNRGETASAFNALAKGIAACSFLPGGVTFCGAHFESEPKWLEVPT